MRQAFFNKVNPDRRTRCSNAGRFHEPRDHPPHSPDRHRHGPERLREENGIARTDGAEAGAGAGRASVVKDVLAGLVDKPALEARAVDLVGRHQFRAGSRQGDVLHRHGQLRTPSRLVFFLVYPAS